jgi:hypothetical protein
MMQRQEQLDEEIEKEDYHELFLKTFSACDGSKYIYYDFNRHMRGVDDMKKYNEFIRVKGHKNGKSYRGELLQEGSEVEFVGSAVRSCNVSVYSG